MGRKPQSTQEFQDNAVRLVVAEGLAAKQLGISSAKLRSWVHRWKRESKLAQNTSQDSYVQELIDLRKENEELREANEILKKAAAYFAKGL